MDFCLTKIKIRFLGFQERSTLRYDHSGAPTVAQWSKSSRWPRKNRAPLTALEPPTTRPLVMGNVRFSVSLAMSGQLYG